MSRHFAALAYSPSVQAEQRRRLGDTLPAGAGSVDAVLGLRERSFIAERDSFFLATVNAEGWPHVQHRGGARGFLRVLDGQTLAFADLSGNRQFVTVGNVRDQDRVALILMDFPRRLRLKVLARMRVLEVADLLSPDAAPEPPLHHLARTANAERVLLLHVAAYDWNCSKHITPRWSEDELATHGLCAPTSP